MWLIGLAARNLARNVRRTAITAVAVVAGVALLILGQALVGGLDENVLRAQIDTVGGHLTLTPPGYDPHGQRAPVEDLVPLPEALRARLAGLAWTERLRFDARLIHGADALQIRGVGYDPTTDAAVFSRKDFGLQGAFPGAGESGVVVGASLASLLDLAPGDRVTLQVRTSKGAQNAQSYPVAGVVRAGNPLIDSFTIFLPASDAQPLIQAPGPSHVSVRLPHRRDTAAQAVRLASPWTATTYLEEAADVLVINSIRRKGLSALVLAILGIAASGIANTVIMSVYERIREVGTLAALGMSPRAIGSLFLWEGALLGSGAALLGAGIGGVLVWRMATVGINLGGLPEAGSRIAMSTQLYAIVDPVVIGLAALFGAGIATLASVIPALHAVRINPADAVRAR